MIPCLFPNKATATHCWVWSSPSAASRETTSPHKTECAIWWCGLYCSIALNIHANKQTRTLGIVKQVTDSSAADESVTRVWAPSSLTAVWDPLRRDEQTDRWMSKWLNEQWNAFRYPLDLSDTLNKLNPHCVLQQQDKQLGPVHCLLLTYLWGRVVRLI